MTPWNICDKTVLITGATDGIGKAVARALAKRGAAVVLVSRDLQKGERIVRELRKKNKNSRIEMIQCDLAQLSRVAACAEEYRRRFSALHVLIHVAGVLSPVREESEDIETTMAVNYFAPVLLTELLLPLMKQSVPARIINVTSSMHKNGVLDLANLKGRGPYDGSQAYANSKLALMLYTLHLSRTLQGNGITVNAVHPGWIRTKLAVGTEKARGLKQTLTSFFQMRPPWYGARSIVYLAASPEADEINGAYIIKKRSADPKRNAQDSVLAEALVQKTRAVLGSRLLH